MPTLSAELNNKGNIMNIEHNESRDLEEFARLINSAENREAFIDFISFCFERLSKGGTVQAIWNDYQQSGNDT